MPIPPDRGPCAIRGALDTGPPAPATEKLRPPRIDGRDVVAIFVGGAAGTLLRAALARHLATDAGGWPWATFVVNVAATFLLGCIVTRLRQRPPPSGYRRPLLGTSLCGGLSTYSAVQVELLHMIGTGAFGLAAGYAAAGVATGYGAVHLGTALARRMGLRP